jgi:hypothetical protein
MHNPLLFWFEFEVARDMYINAMDRSSLGAWSQRTSVHRGLDTIRKSYSHLTSSRANRCILLTAMLREQAWQLCNSPRLMERMFGAMFLAIVESHAQSNSRCLFAGHRGALIPSMSSTWCYSTSLEIHQSTCGGWDEQQEEHMAQEQCQC